MPVLALVLFAAQASCGFNISPATTPLRVQGTDDIVRRVHVVAQPDSPVAITEADFRQFTQHVGPSSFENSGSVAVDVRNIGDRLLTRIRVAVSTRLKRGASGVVLGWNQPVAPGSTARLSGGVHGQGSDPENAEVIVALFVDSVEAEGCLFKPSQAWPLTR